MRYFYRSLLILLSINTLCVQNICAHDLSGSDFIQPKGLVVSSAISEHEAFFGGEYGQLYMAHIMHDGVHWQRYRKSGLGLITDIDESGFSSSKSIDNKSILLSTSRGQIFQVNPEAQSEAWKLIYASESEENLPFFDVAAFGEDKIIAVGAFGTLIYSHDGGQHWQNLTESISELDYPHLYKIIKSAPLQQSKTGVVGYVVGEFGALLQLSIQNNELITVPIETNTESTFFDGAFLSDRWIIFAGVSGSLLALDHTTNQIFASDLCDSKSIYSVRADGTERNLLLAGEGGTVFRLSLLDEGLNAPPPLTCQFYKLNNEKLSNVDIQGERIFMTTDHGVTIEKAATLLQEFTTPVDIQW
ncbi:MAG: YCF48-related protein [Pseudomonadota bacterium]|nr:YCF48-related protein [Pseudomonadota bacterium]HBF08591.1 hypothetical protein [Gammaproteobacteria bacterium]